jgi:hypothetical protein
MLTLFDHKGNLLVLRNLFLQLIKHSNYLSGKIAFETIMNCFYFACSKNPMINRFSNINKNIPIWFLLGNFY